MYFFKLYNNLQPTIIEYSIFVNDRKLSRSHLPLKCDIIPSFPKVEQYGDVKNLPNLANGS